MSSYVKSFIIFYYICPLLRDQSIIDNSFTINFHS